MNLNKPFTYPFEDQQWPTKLGLGVLFSIVPILNFAWMGFIVEVMRNVMKGHPEPMPSWDDLGKRFVDGLLLILAGFIYSLPILLIICLPIAFLIVPALMSNSSNMEDISVLAITTGSIISSCLFCLLMLYFLVYSIIFPAITILYAQRGTFTACFKLREVFSIISKNAGLFFTAWGVYLGTSIGVGLATGMLGAIMGWFPVVGQLVIFLVGVAGSLYSTLVYAHLFGQFGTSTRNNTDLVSA